MFWLTRPGDQGKDLQQALTQLGAACVSLPLLDIRPVTLTVADRQKLLNLDRYDLLFFVSTNAARIGLDAIAHWWPQYPAHINNFAVGPGTAAVLERAGLQVSYPRERMTSEAMLALPGLQQIGGKKALIVRGVGGREIIAAGLQARGAEVDYLELYERAPPQHSSNWLLDLLQNRWPDAVVLSSGEALEHLKALLAPLTPHWAQLSLAVSSPRLAALAETAGFAAALVLPGASDEAIIAGLLSGFTRQASP